MLLRDDVRILFVRPKCRGHIQQEESFLMTYELGFCQLNLKRILSLPFWQPFKIAEILHETKREHCSFLFLPKLSKPNLNYDRSSDDSIIPTNTK
jgi:hypothetical protein